MAFNLVQKFEFERVDYSYDRRGDVLDISFGPPAPGVALQVEDWLAVRMQVVPPHFQGMTIVGFRKIFENETLSSHPEDALRNVYVEKTLPSKQIVGVKILEFTKVGPAAIEGILGAMIDTIFEPRAEHGENAYLITNTLIQNLDWTRLARLVAS